MPHRVKGLKKLAADGRPTTFVTLTVNPTHGETPTERARQLSDAMKIMIKRARRKFTKQRIEYLAVFEETKRGEPHLHMLMRAPFVPQRWLSDQMKELIDAPIVDIRHVFSKKHAANYVAKYVGKGPKAFGTLKRYWTSQGYVETVKGHDRVKDEFGSPWYVVHRPLFLMAQDYTDAGFIVTRQSDNRLWVPIGAVAPPGVSRMAWRDILRARADHGS